MVREEEEIGSFESGDKEEGAGGRTIIKTFDDDLKEEMDRQLKHDEEEARRSPPKGEGKEGGKTTENVELPTGE